MQELADTELLRQYAHQNSEAAFAALVTRHVPLVFSAALRKTGNPSAAQEVTQAVFIILARKARGLRRETALAGWLYQAARLTAANFLRTEIRRARREQEAMMQSLSNETGPETWRQIMPLLEDAMGRLGERERNAVVLRFFERKSFQEIGAEVGATENAAKKRVGHALEKLRRFFLQRGVDSTAAAIGEIISANSVHAVPVGLVKAVSTAALAKGAAASTSTLTLIKGALKIMAWLKAKTVFITGAAIFLTAGLGIGVYMYHSTHSMAGGPASELQSALRIPKPATGTWAYPSEKVTLAIFHFGTNRAAAFPILKKAVESSNAEERKQAVASLQMVGMPARPEYAKYGLLGEPSPKVAPLLWKILNSNDGELSSYAFTALMGIGFQPNQIPVLATLLVRSHGSQPSLATKAKPSVVQMQNLLSRAGNDQMLQRYLPEAIAETIAKNPEAAAPFISSVEDLLDDSNADVRFGAACALAKFKGVNDPEISKELKAALKIIYDSSAPIRTSRSNPEDDLKQLMTIETLQHIGPAAQPMAPVLLDYAENTPDKYMKQLALGVAGVVDTNLLNTMPEVREAFKNEPTLHNPAQPELQTPSNQF